VRQRRYRLHSALISAGLPNTYPCCVSPVLVSLSAMADCRLVSCSLLVRFLSCKQRPSCAIEGTLPNGISWVTPLLTTALRTELGATLDIGVLTTHQWTIGLLPLPVAPSQDAEMTRPGQVPFRFALTTGGPMLDKERMRSQDARRISVAFSCC